ncbi:uncharacterized protein M421DRAFT_95915 [Didymella exigua CBS 183.55]|uniref:Uncharacterized protein n=1 Tax=Didymella exigua CBS 183.55 TaxID=1150837 RepID=A0A6A5R6M0_9PLEO|nr:uncharacterized protein M421DRAFT_95915 [Didymella exigua CBS 183.55]KAF1923811.1 hypothetical protein M421DRAFT_95915 [Didymella exigua CBS 183.55]
MTTKKPFIADLGSGIDQHALIRNTRGVVRQSAHYWQHNEDVKDDNTPGVDGSYWPTALDIDQLEGHDHAALLLGVESVPEGEWLMYGHQGNTPLFKQKKPLVVPPYSNDHFYVKDISFRVPWARKDFPWGFAGDVKWTLRRKSSSPASESEAECIDLGVTRLEYYGIAKLAPLFGGAVDVAFLRTFVLPARSSSATDWPRHVAKAAFWDFGFRYNSSSGASSYASGYTSETFNLRRWTRDAGRNELVNCYDQAGLVQIALALAGPRIGKSQMMHLDPFGFVNPTELVGRGLTNNPFPHSAEQAAKKAGISNTWLVDRNSPYRSPFSRHTFVRLGDEHGRIIDACAGPHLGTETLQEYIDAAVSQVSEGPNDDDPNTTFLYSREICKHPATVGDLNHSHRGVTAINACPIPSPEKAEKREKTPYSSVSMSVATSKGTPAEAPSKFRLSDLTDALERASGMKVELELRVNSFGAHVTYDVPCFLPDGTEKDAIDVQIVVLQTNDQAQKYFEWDLHNYHNTDAEHWEKLGVPEFDDRLSLASAGVDGKRGVIVWVRGQMFLRVEGYPSSIALWEGYGRELDALLRAPRGDSSFQVTVSPQDCTVARFQTYEAHIGVSIVSIPHDCDVDKLTESRGQISQEQNVHWTVTDTTNTDGAEDPELFQDLLLIESWAGAAEATKVQFTGVRKPVRHKLLWCFADEDDSLRTYATETTVQVQSVGQEHFR